MNGAYCAAVDSPARLCRRVIKGRQQEVQPLSMIIPFVVLAGVPVMAGPAHPLDSCLDCNLSAFMRMIKNRACPRQATLYYHILLSEDPHPIYLCSNPSKTFRLLLPTGT